VALRQEIGDDEGQLPRGRRDRLGEHPSRPTLIIGARNLNHHKDSLAAVKIDMTPERRAEIAAFFRTSPPATDRLEEQVVAKG
jgi:hypothetical protein